MKENMCLNPIQQELFNSKDEKYREFQAKLVPNIDPETIIGVRTPEMRRIAKAFYGTNDGEEFLKILPHRYYEENLIHFFMIAMIKDFKTCVDETERFLPFVDCWPVCDQATPKAFKKHHEELLTLIKKWIASDHVYTARFGLRMLMNEFLGQHFKEEFLEWAAVKTGDDYYLKMMVAWFFATALAKQYASSVKYIENRKLDPWIHKKSIQKAIESFRVSDEHKEHLKSYR